MLQKLGRRSATPKWSARKCEEPRKKAAKEKENCSPGETPQTDETHGTDSRTTSNCSESSQRSARASADGARGPGAQCPEHQEK